ncbi:hypothetical protein [Streptomyces chartreusis]|uniref:hypothetical protein n=1 Tax=Streptomyces chartreusis TaxID=1969 RepID=UPI002F916340|nr:hypothetical protein OG938_44245 [Streptomyces chartreusis]WSZ73433.1 hypothetical protein OG938_47550 [Streptomyces chartreusis]WTA33693.1 hypothetical protein OIA45_48130 [Streptomyces chartreusis]
MQATLEALTDATLSRLNAAGFPAVNLMRFSDTMLVASVPDSRRTQAHDALKPFTCLPLADLAGRARFALIPTPDDPTPYSRTVYFRATGHPIPRRFARRLLVDIVLITPGARTEADIPGALSLAVFGTRERTDDITITRLV